MKKVLINGEYDPEDLDEDDDDEDEDWYDDNLEAQAWIDSMAVVESEK